VHLLRLRICDPLVNVLDAGPTPPREELLSDDQCDPPATTLTDSFASDKSELHIAAW
jgi:hypothetical protein